MWAHQALSLFPFLRGRFLTGSRPTHKREVTAFPFLRGRFLTLKLLLICGLYVGFPFLRGRFLTKEEAKMEEKKEEVSIP